MKSHRLSLIIILFSSVVVACSGKSTPPDINVASAFCVDATTEVKQVGTRPLNKVVVFAQSNLDASYELSQEDFEVLVPQSTTDDPRALSWILCVDMVRVELVGVCEIAGNEVALHDTYYTARLINVKTNVIVDEVEASGGFATCPNTLPTLYSDGNAYAKPFLPGLVELFQNNVQ